MSGTNPGYMSFTSPLFKPVGNGPLVLFRILFGFLMSVHCIFSISNGQVYKNFIAPPFTFSFIGFEWLQPLEGNGMYAYFGIMALLALMVMAGLWFRMSSVLLAIMWTATYLMQKVDYNNHYYLMVLLCWLLTLTPAHKRYSLDVARGKTTYADQCDQWIPFLFIAQISLMYVYAGISKFDPDWLSGRFLWIQFSRYRSHQYLGELYSSRNFQLFISYTGLLFDLLIVPALLWKKTRNLAFALSCLFHIFNSYTFRIGIFPYLGMALNVFFYTTLSCQRENDLASVQKIEKSVHAKKLILIFLTIYLLIQFILPLRHFVLPGPVFWTNEGYRMSWKMMSHTKSGKVQFKVTDQNGKLIQYIDPAAELSLNHCMWLAGSPDMIWQYAQRIKNKFRNKYDQEVSVYAIGQVSLNRWPAQALADSTIDLAATRWEPFRHAEWILPFKKP